MKRTELSMILGGSLGMFVDVPSILIVFVGSTFVVLMKFSLAQFLGAMKVAARAFSFKLISSLRMLRRSRRSSCCDSRQLMKPTMTVVPNEMGMPVFFTYHQMVDVPKS